mgnify:CR=1 FL=1
MFALFLTIEGGRFFLGMANQSVILKLKSIKKRFPMLQVIVGNVATQSGFKALCEAGADAIKIGSLQGGAAF